MYPAPSMVSRGNQNDKKLSFPIFRRIHGALCAAAELNASLCLDLLEWGSNPQPTQSMLQSHFVHLHHDWSHIWSLGAFGTSDVDR